MAGDLRCVLELSLVTLDSERDRRLRDEAFGYLRRLQTRTGGPVSQSDLCGSTCGFRFENRSFALKHPQRGIHKPRTFEAALSFSTTHKPPGQRPYDDAAGADGYMRYKWQGSDPDEYTNAAMRKACARGLPLIWFHGIVANLYLPVFPVWLVHEEPDEHQFVVALDPVQRERWQVTNIVSLAEYRRDAATAARTAVHHPVFRARVLAAYEQRCAICHLGFKQLLDAAPIKRDTEGGEPIVPNGIALCRLHHGAYETDLLGIDADYRVEVRRDVLAEGGSLVAFGARTPSRFERPPVQAPPDRRGGALAAIREAHRCRLDVPGKRAAQPDRELLAERFERYREAS